MGSGSITPFYVQPHVRAQLRSQLRAREAFPHVALGNFLTPSGLALAQSQSRGGWTRSVVPDQHSFSTKPAVQVQRELRAFVHMVTDTLPLRQPNARFAHRDYTLLHDHVRTTPGVVALLFLDDVPADSGGDVVFSRRGELLGRFTPKRNTLLIVRRAAGVQQFVRYLNHRMGARTVTIISG